jgi:hypothetical protein
MEQLFKPSAPLRAMLCTATWTMHAGGTSTKFSTSHPSDVIMHALIMALMSTALRGRPIDLGTVPTNFSTANKYKYSCTKFSTSTGTSYHYLARYNTREVPVPLIKIERYRHTEFY